jgi:site-specific recombinase XerD
MKNGKHMMYPSFVKIVKNAAKKAGIEKRIHCHLLRHSGCTHAATELTDAQMRERFGWAPGSAMTGLYVHLCGRNIDKTLFQLHKLDADLQENEDRFTVKKCSCGKLTPAFEDKCVYCGLQ